MTPGSAPSHTREKPPTCRLRPRSRRDHHAEGVTDQPLDEALKNAFVWTQYPATSYSAIPRRPWGSARPRRRYNHQGHHCDRLGHLPAQCQKARARWAHLPKAHFEHGDVLDYLATADGYWDAIHSIWGPVWFTNPEVLLPLIQRIGLLNRICRRKGE
ncbi:hypothetical protein GCM10010177_19520 [Actinomadura citrea]|nr:hypothetical protein GCM10010177_19520 [Actinomadura citrea]